MLKVSLPECNSFTELRDTTASYQKCFELCIRLIAGLLSLLCLDANTLNMHVKRMQAPILFRGIASAVAADAELVSTCGSTLHGKILLKSLPAVSFGSFFGRDQWTRIAITCLCQREYCVDPCKFLTSSRLSRNINASAGLCGVVCHFYTNS